MCVFFYSKDNPAGSCQEIYEKDAGAVSGAYWIKGKGKPFQVSLLLNLSLPKSFFWGGGGGGGAGCFFLYHILDLLYKTPNKHVCLSVYCDKTRRHLRTRGKCRKHVFFTFLECSQIPECFITVQLGLSRLCSATFEQRLAFGATFCGFSNLEQVLPFRAIFEQNIGLEHISSTKKSTISWKTSIHANFLKAYHVINLLNI